MNTNVKNATHTPGPWKAAWNEDKSWIGVDCGTAEDPRQAEVCTVSLESAEIGMEDDEAWERCKADATLIAAAPDMLDALHDAESEIETLLEDLCDEPDEDVSAQRTLATIREALRKAGARED